MKFPRFAFLFLILLAAAVLPAAGQGSALKVGVFPAEPLVFMEDGKPAGLFLDLLGHLAGKHGWDLEFVEGSWSDHLLSLERGELDLLPAVGYTEARRGIFDFNHVPVFMDSGVLFTAPRKAIHTIFDLEGLRVAGVRGSVFTQGFLDFIASFNISCELVYVSTNEEVMRAIESGRVDAGVTIYSLGRVLQRGVIRHS
ncbi:MAG: transporter substrate-binding domain-containing protein [Spirochaetota bacterium]